VTSRLRLGSAPEIIRTPDIPLPIATCTAGYLGGCGLGPVRAPRT